MPSTSSGPRRATAATTVETVETERAPPSDSPPGTAITSAATYPASSAPTASPGPAAIEIAPRPAATRGTTSDAGWPGPCGNPNDRAAAATETSHDATPTTPIHPNA